MEQGITSVRVNSVTNKQTVKFSKTWERFLKKYKCKYWAHFYKIVFFKMTKSENLCIESLSSSLVFSRKTDFIHENCNM